MTDEADDVFLTVEEAAAVMRMAKRTLDNHRWKNTGPKFRRHGGRVVYRRSDLLAWSEQRAARTATREKSCELPSEPSGPNSHRTAGAGLAEGDLTRSTLERQL
mgnify:CR=1 FL=1